jgi:hypothetical protein
MALKKVYNHKTNREEWIDMAYVSGKTDKPDPRHGTPVDKKPKKKK